MSTKRVTVIGAGPAGYVCAIRLAQLGQQVTVIERENLGGTCLNVGCIPSKALIAAGSLVDKISKASAMGITVEGVNVDVEELVSWKAAIVKRLTGGIGTLLEKNGVQVVYGAAKFKSATAVEVTGEAGTQVVEADDVVIATGSTPIELPGFGFDEGDVWSSTGALKPDRVPDHIVVIGGGYIGLEAAAAFAARGAKPAVVMMEPHVMARLWTPTIAAHYEALYESKGCVFHKNAKVSAIARGEDGRVKSVELEGGASLPADLVVGGVGAGAVTAPFDALDTTPDARNPGGILVDATFAASGVNVEPKSVYAIGDVAAFPLAFDKNQTVRMEHVAHARASAAHCARCVLAADDDDAQTANAPYQYTPYFYSRVFEQADSTRKVAWVFYGLQRGEVVCVGDFAPKLAAFWVDEGVCVGAMLESGTPDEVKAVQAIAEGRPSVDVEKLRACATAEAALSLFA